MKGTTFRPIKYDIDEGMFNALRYEHADPDLDVDEIAKLIRENAELTDSEKLILLQSSGEVKLIKHSDNSVELAVAHSSLMDEDLLKSAFQYANVDTRPSGENAVLTALYFYLYSYYHASGNLSASHLKCRFKNGINSTLIKNIHSLELLATCIDGSNVSDEEWVNLQSWFISSVEDLYLAELYKLRKQLRFESDPKVIGYRCFKDLLILSEESLPYESLIEMACPITKSVLTLLGVIPREVKKDKVSFSFSEFIHTEPYTEMTYTLERTSILDGELCASSINDVNQLYPGFNDAIDNNYIKHVNKAAGLLWVLDYSYYKAKLIKSKLSEKSAAKALMASADVAPERMMVSQKNMYTSPWYNYPVSLPYDYAYVNKISMSSLDEKFYAFCKELSVKFPVAGKVFENLPDEELMDIYGLINCIVTAYVYNAMISYQGECPVHTNLALLARLYSANQFYGKTAYTTEWVQNLQLEGALFSMYWDSEPTRTVAYISTLVEFNSTYDIAIQRLTDAELYTSNLEWVVSEVSDNLLIFSSQSLDYMRLANNLLHVEDSLAIDKNWWEWCWRLLDEETHYFLEDNTRLI